MKRKNRKKTSYKLGRKFVEILNIRLNSTSASSVLKHISELISERKRFLVVTPNPEIIMAAQRDAVLAGILNSADISLPDGVGLVWASKLQARPTLSSPLIERVSGVDIMEKLIGLATKHDWRVFLLGGRPGVAEEAVGRLSRNFQFSIFNFQWDEGPWLNKEGRPVNKTEERKEKEAVHKINEFKPHLLFVGFGAPKQEKWASRCLRHLEVNCVMVVGGAFDYISGRVPRAPVFIIKLGFEWLFRLVVEPWRIKRQLTLLRFIWAIVRS